MIPDTHTNGPVDSLMRQQAHAISGRWLGLGLLAFVYMLNFMDRQILAVLIEPIKREIKVSDTQVGLLTGTYFAIFYSLVTVPVAVLADRINRVRIVAAGCLMWSLFTGMTGFAGSFLHLAIARVGLALGEAGGLAPSLSIISDYFPPKKRVGAMSLFMSASPLGVLVGTLGGGYLAAHYGWRAAFQTAAVIGILCVPLLLLLVREPRRGALDAPSVMRASGPIGFLDTMRLFLHMRSLFWLAISAGLFSIVTNALITWMPALLMRSYGASMSDVALYYGPLVGVALACGIWASGASVGFLSVRSVKAYALLPAAAILLCAPLFALALLSSSWQSTLAFLFVPILLCNFGIAPVLTVVQNLAPANARSTASALLMMVLNLIGLGCGPLIVGLVSDALSSSLGPQSLRYGMLGSLVPTMLLCAVTLYLASRSITVDHKRVQGAEFPV